MMDLEIFPNSSVTAIYASHVLEHVSYQVNEELRHTLREWHRVLKPGGVAFISVPDLAVLSKLFAESPDPQDRYKIMRMMFGGHIDEYDMHKVGFDQNILEAYLEECGFCNFERKELFELFMDTSRGKFHDTFISLNVIAEACKEGDRISVKLDEFSYLTESQ